MTLTAINPKTEERFYAPSLVDPKTEISCIGDLVSPITLEPVNGVRQSNRCCAHFRHRQRSAKWPEDVIPDDEYFACKRINESFEHLRTKQMICADGKMFTPQWDESYASTEVRIWIPFRSRYRIADVVMQSPTLQMVVEVQYSPITINDLQQRTDDYFEAGYDVQWVFGPKNHSFQIYRWHEDYIKYPAIIAETIDHLQPSDYY